MDGLPTSSAVSSSCIVCVFYSVPLTPRIFITLVSFGFLPSTINCPSSGSVYTASLVLCLPRTNKLTGLSPLALACGILVTLVPSVFIRRGLCSCYVEFLSDLCLSRSVAITLSFGVRWVCDTCGIFRFRSYNWASIELNPRLSYPNRQAFVKFMISCLFVSSCWLIEAASSVSRSTDVSSECKCYLTRSWSTKFYSIVQSFTSISFLNRASCLVTLPSRLCKLDDMAASVALIDSSSKLVKSL